MRAMPPKKGTRVCRESVVYGAVDRSGDGTLLMFFRLFLCERFESDFRNLKP